MAKSKLVGEFDLDGSPLSAFNVSKAMAKAREAALAEAINIHILT